MPTLSFFTGSHEDYHRPTDVADADRLRRASIASRRSARQSPRDLADCRRPAARSSASPRRRARAADARCCASRPARSRTTPPKSQGLLLGGVVAGGPAEQAGLRKGDVIVEIAGQKIANIYDYTYALDVLKPDVPVTVVFMRDGQRQTTTLTPRARR